MDGNICTSPQQWARRPQRSAEPWPAVESEPADMGSTRETSQPSGGHGLAAKGWTARFAAGRAADI